MSNRFGRVNANIARNEFEKNVALWICVDAAGAEAVGEQVQRIGLLQRDGVRPDQALPVEGGRVEALVECRQAGRRRLAVEQQQAGDPDKGVISVAFNPRCMAREVAEEAALPASVRHVGNGAPGDTYGIGVLAQIVSVLVRQDEEAHVPSGSICWYPNYTGKASGPAFGMLRAKGWRDGNRCVLG